MNETWEYVKDRWEWDSAWREQIILAILVGGIGLLFTVAECLVKRGVNGG